MNAENIALRSLNGYTLSVSELLTYKASIIQKIKSLGSYAFFMHVKGYDSYKIGKTVGCKTWLVRVSYVIYLFHKNLTKNTRKKRLKIKKK